MSNSTDKCTRVIKSNIGTWDTRVLITGIRKESLNRDFDQLVGYKLGNFNSLATIIKSVVWDRKPYLDKVEQFKLG